MRALGEFVSGEEFGVATGAVARAQGVEEALLGDGDGCRGGWVRWPSGVYGFGGRSPSGSFGSLRSLRMTALVRVSGGGLRLGDGAALAKRWFESWHSDLEAIDHLAGAASVDGIVGEAMNNCGQSDEDGGAFFDDRNLHASDIGVDEDAVILAIGVLNVVVIAVHLSAGEPQCCPLGA